MTAVTVEYIWLDGGSLSPLNKGGDPTQQLRSKTKVLYFADDDILDDDDNLMFTMDDVPDWSFDGSSTNQAEGGNSDRYLKPVFLCGHPMREDGFIVMCEVLMPDGETPHVSNTRAKLRDVLDHVPTTEEPIFGLEQEYFLLQNHVPLGCHTPYGPTNPTDQFKPNVHNITQGQYYCAVGNQNVFGRNIMNMHMDACIQAGLLVAGTNLEVAPGQAEIQIGPLDPLMVADQLWVARWLLQRIAEGFDTEVSFAAKPFPNLNGSGCHANFSTASMRQKATVVGDTTKGIDAINAWCEAARGRTHEHLAAYGYGIEARLTGEHETCSYQDFKYGVSDRTASIRIPLATANGGCGYLEDRRPNANANPYDVCRVMLETLLSAGAEASYD